MCPLTVILRAPLEWPMLLRGASSLPMSLEMAGAVPEHISSVLQNTEYFAGANAAGPYLAAKSLSELPFAYAPMLLVTILYWMTGTRALAFHLCPLSLCRWHLDTHNPHIQPLTTGLEPGWDEFLKFGGVVVLATQAACALALMVASFSANALLTLALRAYA